MPSRRAWLLSTLPVLAADWPTFRGPGHLGLAPGKLPTEWNCDPAHGPDKNIAWKTPLPGTGHASPILLGDKIYLLAAESEDPANRALKLGYYGDIKPADDNGLQTWFLLCLDRRTGRELFRKPFRKQKPGSVRHPMSTHANSTLASDGAHLVAALGADGLHCFDKNGKVLWQVELGPLRMGMYGAAWGSAGSAAIWKDRVFLTCDDVDDPFFAAYSLKSGKQLYRVSRKGISERSWATPFVLPHPEGAQVIANGFPWIVAYSASTGEVIWRMKGGGDVPVPTPFTANGLLYITNGHGGKTPVYAIRPTAKGDITGTEHVAWTAEQGGAYLSTPVVYQGNIYLANFNGIIRCFDAVTGRKHYEQRLGGGSNAVAVAASLVAGDGKVYVPTQDGDMLVLAAGNEFKVLAKNAMGAGLMATPAISGETLYVRTATQLVAVTA